MTDKQEPLGGVDVGDALRVAFAVKGLRRVQVAAGVGTTPSHLGHIVRGEVSPSMKMIGRIADFLGMNTVEMLSYGRVEKDKE